MTAVRDTNLDEKEEYKMILTKCSDLNCGYCQKEHDNRLICPEMRKAAAERQLKRDMQCQAVCGDGTGKEPEKHYVGCPRYQSGHSISADGYCNMGCC